MPVDRSLLPPLPGKPDWYVENAPMAVDPDAPGSKPAAEPLWSQTPVVSLPQQSESTASLLPSRSSLTPAQFPTASTEAEHGKGLRRVKAFAGRLKH